MFDAHTDAEFKTRDIEATMATMSGAPHVTHVPTMTGGSGREAVQRFYARQGWTAGVGRRASGATARSEPAVKHADP